MKPWYKRGLPGWFQFGGGGGGGLSIVTTNATLTGTGTVATPLGVAGWPVTYFQQFVPSVAGAVINANEVIGQGIVLNAPVSFSKIGVTISVADVVNLYDLGIYTQAGVLLADIGPQTLPAIGIQSFATLQGLQTIGPGLYIFAMTANVSVAQFNYDSQTVAWMRNTNIGASVGGQLPTPIAAQPVVPASNPTAVFLS